MSSACRSSPARREAVEKTICWYARMNVVTSADRAGPVSGCCTGMCSFRPRTPLLGESCKRAAERAETLWGLPPSPNSRLWQDDSGKPAALGQKRLGVLHLNDIAQGSPLVRCVKVVGFHDPIAHPIA